MKAGQVTQAGSGIGDVGLTEEPAWLGRFGP